MLEHLFSEGSRIFNLRSLCHDAVLRIAEHDRQNKGGLLQTLKVYLLQEKSLLAGLSGAAYPSQYPGLSPGQNRADRRSGLKFAADPPAGDLILSDPGISEWIGKESS